MWTGATHCIVTAHNNIMPVLLFPTMILNLLKILNKSQTSSPHCQLNKHSGVCSINTAEVLCRVFLDSGAIERFMVNRSE